MLYEVITPLTSALISELYGLALTGRVFGAANAVHHLAGAAGAYLAGLVFDATGSYLPVFVLGAVMVYAAAALTWRNSKQELTEYFTELTTSPVREYMRPNLFANTPDILHEYLQTGGRPAFQIRLVSYNFV